MVTLTFVSASSPAYPDAVLLAMQVAIYEEVPNGRQTRHVATFQGTPKELAALSAPKPTFQWIETTSWRCADGNKAVTPATVRAESWLAIAGGAHGLGFFPASFSPEIGQAIAGVSHQVAKLGPALMGPAIPADSDQATVKVGARTYQNAVYVIAVNSGFSPVQATVKVPGLAGRTLEVLDEGRTVDSGDGAFVDSFAPLTTHVYIAAPVG